MAENFLDFVFPSAEILLIPFPIAEKGFAKRKTKGKLKGNAYRKTVLSLVKEENC